jgi:hypothetical protein
MARKNRGARRWSLWGSDKAVDTLIQEHRTERLMSGDRQVQNEILKARLYETSAYIAAAT